MHTIRDSRLPKAAGRGTPGARRRLAPSRDVAPRRRAGSPQRLIASAVAAALLSGFTAVPAVAADRQVQTVWTWGGNASGQVGDGTATSSPAPVAIPGMGGMAAVAAGSGHSLAVRGSDGTVWAWGGNRHGQLGDGTTQDRPVPGMVPAGDGTFRLLGMVAVAAGDHHSLALRDDGRVFAWGSNASGQLGDAPTGGTYPVLVRGVQGVTAIAAGARHSVALRGTAVLAWGDNAHGQLGDGQTLNRARPVAVPHEGEVVAIAAGDAHTLAVRRDGTVLSWGSNASGQLGDDSAGRSAPAEVPGLRDVVEVAAGAHHSLARDRNGTVWAWGDNRSGQLGDGTTTSRSTPAPIGEVTGPIGEVAAIAAGDRHSVALLRDGSALSWGDNAEGQLGDGSTTGRSAPVRVRGASDVAVIAAGGAHNVTLWSTRAVPPAAPTQVRATAGDASARVSWTAPPDGGSPITGYTVTVPGGEPVSVAASVTSAEITGLTNGQPYTFTVHATNEAGSGPAASSEVTTPLAATAPDAPTGVRAVAGDASAYVWWNAPASDNRAPITSYVVTVWSGDDVIGVEDVDTGTATSATIPGLTNGRSYRFTVVAVNRVGPGPSSTPSNPVTPSPPTTHPGAPSDVKATAKAGSAEVAWTPPASDGGAPISEYTVTASDGRSIAVHDGTATSATVTGLTAGRSYSFTVTATNAAGAGPPSPASNTVTPTPLPVTDLSRTVRFDALTSAAPKPRVELGWTTQGAPEAIEVTWSDGSTQRSVTLSPAPSTYTVTGLSPGRAYTFWVRAVVGGVRSTHVAVSTYGTVVTSSVKPAVVTSGGTTTVSGTLTGGRTAAPLGDRPVRLQISTQNASGVWSSWSNVGSAVRTTASGTYAISHRTPRNARYRVVFAGTGSDLGSVSPLRRVNVAPKVTATLSTTSMRLGSSARLSGTVSPDLAGRTVHLQRRVDGRWVDVGSQRLTSTSGYRFTLEPGWRATHTYRVRVPAYAPYVAGSSPSRSLNVN